MIELLGFFLLLSKKPILAPLPFLPVILPIIVWVLWPEQPLYWYAGAMWLGGFIASLILPKFVR